MDLNNTFIEKIKSYIENEILNNDLKQLLNKIGFYVHYNEAILNRFK